MDKSKNTSESRSPASDKGRRRQESILDAAEAVLVEDGYREFTSRGIAERLGIRLSNVQYYFPTRESMLAGVFERSLNVAARALTESADNGGIEPLVRFILADQQSPRSCRLFWELWALAARDKAAAQVKNEFYRAYQNALETAIAEEVPESTLQQRQHRALMMMSLLEGVSLFRSADSKMLDAGHTFDKTLVETLMLLARG